MARTINTTTHQQQFGAEPINIIEVQWVEDGPRLTYADRDIPAENILGKIVLLDKLDFTINIDEGSDSQEINIGLSDVDNDLKDIIDNHDIHKRNVWVYQWFEDDAFVDKFLIFQGEINSPIVWNERDRTLKFAVISKIEDAEIGFSIEEGQFPNPPEDLIGKPWPLKFGTTIKVPALALSTPKEGTLAGGVGIRDFNLQLKLDAALGLTCPLVFKGFTCRYVGISIVCLPVFVPEEGCILDKCRLIEDLKTKITEQGQFEYPQISIVNGDKFIQSQQITLDIGGGKFTGQFIGTTENPSNVFEIVSRVHPKVADLGIATEDSVNAAIQAEKDDLITSQCEGGFFTSTDAGFVTIAGDFSNLTEDPSVTIGNSSALSWEFYSAIPCPGFFWADAGSKVTIDSGEETIYISNLLPETIESVSAFKNLLSGQRLLLTVPPSLYTTRSTNYNTYQVSEIVFTVPLSRTDPEWEDNIFVISTSSVGPNTVDIIEFLIQKYTSLSIDATSFALVKAAIDNYPSDFPILDRRNVLTVLREIAFQARCAIFVRNQKFFLKYLPTLAAFDDTIVESDVDENTLEIFHTDTEELVTKLIADWKRDYSIDEGNKIILRHNIKKYGTHEDTFNFYIYNELDYVHKSATFWLIRKSNTWRNLRLKTPLQKLKLETFDSVGITLPDLADGEVCGIITKADYNSNTQTVEFEIWTSIRSGTRVKYDFAFPADIDETLVWPTQEDRDLNFAGSGDAPGFTVFAPPGHPLSRESGLIQGFSFGPCASQGLPTASFVDQTCGGGTGDTYTSDEGDTKKVKQTEADTPAAAGAIDPGEVNRGDRINVGGTSQINEILRRLSSAEQCCRENTQRVTNANEAAGGDGSSGSGGDNPLNNLPSADDLPEGACKHQVEVDLHIGEVLYKDEIVSSTDPGWPGEAPFVRRDIHTFNSKAEMNAFAQEILIARNVRRDAQDVNVGEVFIFNLRRKEDTRVKCAEEPDNPGIVAFDQENPDGSPVDDFTPPEYIE